MSWSHAAHAVILQIDGTIVPQTTRIQQGLNKGENGVPYNNTATPPVVVGAGPKGPIDPIFEASEQPQVFAVPRLANNQFGSVTFIDLLEGAGYENTFGWYNVGDDLSTLANLHSVLTCTPVNYEATPAASSQATVDFQAEYTAGRYKGGFIGFFLVTPQGCPSCNNCGNPLSSNGVGRIYYTEKEINGDGNYVHFLVYQTKVTDAAGTRLTDFYFGFEDLYRGGDNDFEDMLVFVRGLVVPCVPAAEVCDGKDNNCDGLVDNDPVDTGTSCSTIPNNHPGVGECKAGVWACTGGAKVCINEVGPTAEACDGKDNDCDGTADNPPGGTFVPSLPNACPPQTQPCTAVTQCINGAPACVVTHQPAPETCNGVDDDCNGIIDDNPSDVGIQCTPSGIEPTIGECKVGITVCTNGTLSCSGYVGPTQEVCDGKDNDCDGQADEAPLTGLAAQCSPQGVTVCTLGHEVCVSGVKVCVDFAFGEPETCNGVDDDCNGVIDDNLLDVGGPCGSDVGACEPGTLQCVAQTPGDPATDTIQCVGASLPANEVCDGVDNDCDGFVDEDPDGGGPQTLPGVGQACGDPSGCGAGITVCKNGAIACITGGLGKAETCNGIDDDCNGIVDDNLIDTGAFCGQSAGACEPGTIQCVPQVSGDPTTDQIACVGGVGPVTEVCNGIDDDCDGFIDEDPDGSGPGHLDGADEPCSEPGAGACGAGLTACRNGLIVCEIATVPAPEKCNGIDDDCDGEIDEDADLTDTGGPCGSGLGVCQPGILTCVHDADGNASIECVGATTGTDEVCNNRDDNCNGVADEGDLPGENEECPPEGMTLPLQGLCKAGKTVCISGVIECVGAIGPRPEVCDGLDNDCDGATDTPDPCPGESVCIAGNCSEPCSGTEFTPCPAGQECRNGYCQLRDCSNLCASGTVCDPATGLCVATDGGVGGAGGSAGDGGTDGQAGTGATGGSGTGGAPGSDAASGGGASSPGGSGATGIPGDSNGDGVVDNWGLATGGGGCACGVAESGNVGTKGAITLSLLVMAAAIRRGRREVCR